jgi:hypothetical protein
MAQTKTGLRTVRLPELLVERLTGHPWILSAGDKERRASGLPGTPSVSELVALGLRIGLDSADAMERARVGGAS